MEIKTIHALTGIMILKQRAHLYKHNKGNKTLQTGLSAP